MAATRPLTAEWMFADAASGRIGFGELAFLNPLRWSGGMGLEEAAASLEELPAPERQRPVRLKIPAGIFTPEKRFESATEAAGHLRRTLARSARAAVSWSVELTEYLCARGEEQRFQARVPLLPVEEFTSVQAAVDQLNVNERLCPGGICVVFSKRLDGYVLVFRADKRGEAKATFGLGSMGWKEFAQRRDSKQGYRFGDLARGLVARLDFLGDVWGSCSGLFDARRLVMVRSGGLDSRYERVRELGAGAQGTASLLRRRRTGQEYVAKAAGASGDGLEDMRAEFKKMQALRHPRCAKVVEYLETPEEAITICEFAQLGDLGKYIDRESPPIEILADIFKQAMAGVAFLHSSGCVHNDLKPENLLVYAGRQDSRAPRVAISDYGCARFVEKDQRLRFGDPRYMSPENVRSMVDYLRPGSTIHNVEQRPAGDVWSMGVTLFEMLSRGVLPFLYERCSFQRMMEESGIFERLQDCITSPGEVDCAAHCPGAPPLLRALLPALLEKDEHCRPTAQRVLAVVREEAQQQEAPSGSPQPSSLPPPPPRLRPVKLGAQQHRACQVLLNCVMWRLQSQHVDELYEVFERFNTSNSGRLSREELRRALEDFSQDASGADELFDMADIDGDGALEFNEFAAVGFDWGSMDEGELDKHIQELLEDLSASGADALTERELADFLGEAVDRDELLQLFMRIDAGSKGRIEATDFRVFLQRHRHSASPAVACEVPVR